MARAPRPGGVDSAKMVSRAACCASCTLSRPAECRVEPSCARCAQTDGRNPGRGRNERFRSSATVVAKRPRAVRLPPRLCMSRRIASAERVYKARIYSRRTRQLVTPPSHVSEAQLVVR